MGIQTYRHKQTKLYGSAKLLPGDWTSRTRRKACGVYHVYVVRFSGSRICYQTAYLDYSYGDTKILFKLIQDGEKTSLEEKKRQEESVHRVVQYCQNSVDCRRVQLLRFFGQNFSPTNCRKRCNNCSISSEVVVEDMTDIAKNAVRLIQSLINTGERVTRNHCMNVFRGSNLKEIRGKRHDSLPLFGSGRDLGRDKIERLFDHLINDLKVLKEYSVQNHQGWNTLYLQVKLISSVRTF